MFPARCEGDRPAEIRGGAAVVLTPFCGFLLDDRAELAARNGLFLHKRFENVPGGVTRG
jgi:hypothetical protein